VRVFSSIGMIATFRCCNNPNWTDRSASLAGQRRRRYIT
jgi:hypothetical protein